MPDGHARFATVVLKNHMMLLRAPRRAHSEKPDEFYAPIRVRAGGASAGVGVHHIGRTRIIPVASPLRLRGAQ
jgi:hypothetical protein